MNAAPRHASSKRRSILFAVLAISAMAAAAHAQNCPTYAVPQTAGTIQSASITEASGIAVSRQHAQTLWMHNDSGDTNRIFAITTGGASLGTFTLSGATAIDWEDIATGPGPAPGIHYLYIGDTGDNLNFRPSIVIYRVAEPALLTTQTLQNVDAIRLTYPDGPRDAETLMIDTNGDIYIVSKRVTAQGRVYRAAFPQSTTQTTQLQFVAEIPWGAANGNGGATAGDISADGSAIIIRRASGFLPAATLWRRPPGTNLWDVFTQPGCNITIPSQPQGESIAFTPTGLNLYTTSEGTNQPIHFIPRVPKPGDINGDDTVNVNDLLTFINNWGRCPSPPTPCPADIAPPPIGDGQVNTNDLLYIINNWG